MTRLSVNINKVALLRNSREGNFPDLYKVAADCEKFGAEGITVHPRPDQRHIRYSDLPILKKLLTTEFNIEGYPSRAFMDLVMEIKPDQCTLVPDPPGVLTSNTGWDTKKNLDFLKDVVAELQEGGIRVSLFHNAEPKLLDVTILTRTDRIELYTGDYAKMYKTNPKAAISQHAEISKEARAAAIGVNAGHDLNLSNLHYYKKNVPGLLEVSIGHALIADALYFGLENTILMYLRELKRI